MCCHSVSHYISLAIIGQTDNVTVAGIIKNSHNQNKVLRFFITSFSDRLKDANPNHSLDYFSRRQIGDLFSYFPRK